jgi:Protein of unknown function (DUF2723)
MTGSYLDRSEQESGIGNQESAVPVSTFRFPRRILYVIAAYVAAHLVFLAPSLEDIDSINFALGLRHFDIASHQPHPPGYPVYIALGRVSLTVIRALAPSLDTARAEAIALALWSAIGGGVALLAAWAFFAEVGRYRDRSRGVSPFFKVGGISFWATTLLAASPLFWISGMRPLSDMPGLAMAMAAQALALRGSSDRRLLVWAALLAGVAAGFRVQTACLTVPMLAFAMWSQRSAGVVWLATRPALALIVGGLAWAVPLIVSSGGIDAYLRALGSQAGEDFAWTGMLWVNRTPRRLMFALWETFALPWDTLALAVTIGVASAAGAIVSILRDRRALAVVALAFAPYLAWHLLFQETVFVRYALPTLPLVTWLAVRGAAVAGRAAPYVTAVVVALALVIAVPDGVVYARQPHPAFQAIAAMKTRAADSAPAAIYSHFSLRRPLQATAPGHMTIVEPRRSYEWLGLVDYWRRGGDAPVWFLADARRTDLALIDPQSRTHVTQFRWNVADRWTMSGARPTGVDWYVFDRPGWFAGEGWALTPEVGGVSQAAGTGVDRRPIEAYVRRRPGAIRIMVGGRHFSAPRDSPATIAVAIDGVDIATWKVDPAPGGASFLRFIDLPGGLPTGDGTYARLTITAHADPPSRTTPSIAVRQFDIQSADTLMYGFGEGWHEEEYETATGLRWRWTSDKSVLQVAPAHAVKLGFRGESPRKYFDSPPTVRITAGGQMVGEFHPERDFTWYVTVPADVVQRARGAIAIEVDRVYLPGPVEGTTDSRKLGLRLFETTVAPLAPPDRP